MSWLLTECGLEAVLVGGQHLVGPSTQLQPLQVLQQRQVDHAGHHQRHRNHSRRHACKLHAGEDEGSQARGVEVQQPGHHACRARPPRALLPPRGAATWHTRTACHVSSGSATAVPSTCHPCLSRSYLSAASVMTCARPRTSRATPAVLCSHRCRSAGPPPLAGCRRRGTKQSSRYHHI